MADNPLDAEMIPGADKAGREAMPTPKSVPNADAFQSYMSEGAEGAQNAGGVMSPMELAASERPSLGTPTVGTVLNQVNDTQSTLNDVKNKLQTPNLQLQSSQEHLLNDKITNTGNHLQQATRVVGANELPPPQTSGNPSVVERFANYVDHGQNQLLEVKKQLEGLQQQGKSLQPGELLLMQVNLAQAQQSIEYSSVLLSKAVDAIKQTINIQI